MSSAGAAHPVAVTRPTLQLGLAHLCGMGLAHSLMCPGPDHDAVPGPNGGRPPDVEPIRGVGDLALRRLEWPTARAFTMT